MAETAATGIWNRNFRFWRDYTWWTLLKIINVDTFGYQGWAFTSGGIPPAQIKPKYDSLDIYNLNSLFKGQ